MEFELWADPAYPSRYVDEIVATLERRSSTGLRLHYRVRGSVADIVIPPPAAPVRTNNLWQTTCFEAFIRPKDLVSYREFNFSPSGAWAAYAFRAYRDGLSRAAMPAPPEMNLTRGADWLDLEVLLSIDLPDEPYVVSLTAVVEERSGGRTYWAASHPQGGPDFHHPSCISDDLPPAPAP
jgi:hypothetical protein